MRLGQQTVQTMWNPEKEVTTYYVLVNKFIAGKQRRAVYRFVFSYILVA